MYKKKYKLILLILLLLIILGLSIYIYIFNFNYLFQEKYYNINKRDKVIENIKNTHKYNPNLFDNIEINNQYTYYNEVEETYYFYFDTDDFNKVKRFDIKILTNDNTSSNYIINSDNYNEKKKIKVTYNDEVEVLVYNDKHYSEIKIKFINVPIMNIEIESDITFEEKISKITLYSKENNTNKKFISSSLIKVRGGMSTNFPKRSYRLKLVKNSGKNKVSLLGMREDEDWILNGLYSEPSLIRNKLSFDLWNQINSYNTYTVNNDIKMEYITLYINNEYIGLYLLQEPVDSKTMKLDSNGILIKGFSYDILNYPNHEIETSIYKPFELKYPKISSGYHKYWVVILSKMKDYFINNTINDYIIEETFDIENFINYKIFSYAIYAADNLGTQNIYLSLKNLEKNTKLVYTPWDLDATFGYSWSGAPPTYINDKYYNYCTNINIFSNNTPKTNRKIAVRYIELRKSILSANNINSMLNEYVKHLSLGEAEKNNNKWIKANLEEEVSRLREYLFKRLECFDEYVGDYDV